jgi:hypothetical protein
MMMTAATGGIGVTFYSQYANQDVYYRLRRYGGNAFHLAPHPHNAVQLEGDTDTGVTPRPGDWYWFRVEVEDAGQRTEIRAKVWPQGSPEPEDWQVNAWHGGSRRPLAGRIGLWSYAAGAKYWDDLLVYPVQPRQVWTLELTELGQGTITAEPDQAQYQDGQEVSLTAVGSPGWRFEAWGGDLAGSDSPARLAMDGDKQVQATFVQEAYTLDVQVIGSGAVTATPNQGTYGHGEIVSLRAVAAKGWRLDRWEGDLTGAANPVRLAMDGNKTVVALFVPEAYALTIDVEGSGQATATPQKATYTYQEAVQIEAVPEAGWAFSGWSGDLSGTENPATVIIQRDTLVTARFQPGLALYAEDFEGYSAGADPEGWLDTQAGNSMAQNDPLFSVFDTGGNRAFGTRSTDTNIHSHYVGSGSRTWSGYRYRGRMMMTAATGGLGVTLYSQYADRDAYYRLRRYGTRTFHLAPHPHRTVTLQGDTDTGQRPQRDIWYWFVLEVEDTGGRTEIRAKVWPEGTGEPEAWQVNAWHSGSGRLLSGRIGVWSYSLGAKYWDDLVVEPIE